MTQENHEIGYEQLVDVAEERLSEEVSAELLRRMDSKKLAEVASLKKIISLMRQDASESAPAPLLHRTFRLFSEQHARKARKPLLKRLFAALKFDSFVGSPAYGVRAERRETRHLLFEAGRHELDMRRNSVGRRVSRIFHPAHGAHSRPPTLRRAPPEAPQQSR